MSAKTTYRNSATGAQRRSSTPMGYPWIAVAELDDLEAAALADALADAVPLTDAPADVVDQAAAEPKAEPKAPAQARKRRRG